MISNKKTSFTRNDVMLMFLTIKIENIYTGIVVVVAVANDVIMNDLWWQYDNYRISNAVAISYAMTLTADSAQRFHLNVKC